MRTYLSFFVVLALFSCNGISEKAEKTLNQAGEAAGKGAGEIIDGVSKGLESSFDVDLKLSEEILNSGVSVGKKVISSANGGTDNWVAVYLIFNQDYNKMLTAKVLDPDSNEYGRATAEIEAKEGNTFFVDFYFDKRTNIDAKSTIVIE